MQYYVVETLLQVLYVIISTRCVAEMLIKHNTKPSALFHVKHKQGNALTILKFPEIYFNKTCFLVNCNLNGGSLILMQEL